MKAIVMVGIPGCGKTTAVGSLANYVEVNRDLLRLAITGRIDDHSREGRVTCEHARRIAQAAAERRNLVVSDTNTVRRYRRDLIRRLKQLGYFVEVHVFDVGLRTCLERNRVRAKPVHERIMRQMAHRLHLNPPDLLEGMDTIRTVRQEDAQALF